LTAGGKRWRDGADSSWDMRAARAFREAVWRGDFDDAFELGDRLAARGPCAEAYEVLVCPIDRDMPRDASLTELWSALERDDGDSHLAWRTHLSVVILERLEWAELALSRSAALVSLPERYGWMRVNRGALLRNLGAYDEAIVEYRASIHAAPRFWKAAACMAECELCLGRETEALAQLDACVEQIEKLGPARDLAPAIAWRSLLDLWTGRYEEALKRIEPAAETGYPLALGWRGAAHFLLGRPGRALADLDRAIALSEGDIEARIWRGEVYSALEDWTSALADFDPGVEMGWIWGAIDRALVRAAIGDMNGLASDFARIPKRAQRLFAWRLGIELRFDESERPDRDKAIALLTGMRESARGLRRPEAYLSPIWMPLPWRP